MRNYENCFTQSIAEMEKDQQLQSQKRFSLIKKDPYNTGSGTKNSINEKETPEFIQRGNMS